MPCAFFCFFEKNPNVQKKIQVRLFTFAKAAGKVFVSEYKSTAGNGFPWQFRADKVVRSRKRQFRVEPDEPALQDKSMFTMKIFLRERGVSHNRV